MLGEPIGWDELIAACLVFGGIAIAEAGRKRSPVRA